jgi:hypothetical protein
MRERDKSHSHEKDNHRIRKNVEWLSPITSEFPVEYTFETKLDEKSVKVTKLTIRDPKINHGLGNMTEDRIFTAKSVKKIFAFFDDIKDKLDEQKETADIIHAAIPNIWNIIRRLPREKTEDLMLPRKPLI